MMQHRSFLSSLFDFSFTSFITTKLVKAIYAFNLLFNGLIAMAVVAAGFDEGFFTGILALLIAAPLVFLFLTVIGRIFLEVAIAFIRNVEISAQIETHTQQIARSTASTHSIA